MLATAVKADWLLLLTDVDGFYVPQGKRPRLLRTVRRLTAQMEALCNGKGKLGTGGMRSKSSAPPSWPGKPKPALRSPTGAMPKPFRGRWSEKSELIFRRIVESQSMATSVTTSASTRDRLLRARKASAQLAQLSTAQKNDLLLAMANTITANAAGIIEANDVDLNSSGLTGAMRERLLARP